MRSPIFYQLFDQESSTYTYIIGDPSSRQALIIDPVRDQMDRDLKLITELGLELRYILDTHIHADHITASGELRRSTGAQIVMGSGAAIAKPDILLADQDILELGDISVRALSTPGHTSGCTSYLIADMLFTGDTLLIRKTGRSDFQGGSSSDLYESIQKLYTLPDETIIYPGHDYSGHTRSSIKEEKKYNTRITPTTTKDEFVQTMSALSLPHPKYIREALPANLALGLTHP